ncbi:hypothetical protein D3OALGA1CA_4428 [Olavius algarvensis associated proteobacterium Delta 3]|nr:hypothetical protein D3OALGB2SA_3688 [Olavius algarvensis associated proteobacterium Delta 3]CAB5151125.1 hypothetical protein D3OALGA1CA_4428 [Olavius algarvensis associated proteobacterium Delta 3]
MQDLTPLSAMFEGYHWTVNALVGVALVLAGNLIILTPRSTFRRILSQFRDISVLKGGRIRYSK